MTQPADPVIAKIQGKPAELVPHAADEHSLVEGFSRS